MMSNLSIQKAFERMWVHIINALGNKASITDVDSLRENVSSTYETKTDATTKNLELKNLIDDKANILHTHDAITNDEVDEICNITITTFLNEISSEEVSF